MADSDYRSHDRMLGRVAVALLLLATAAHGVFLVIRFTGAIEPAPTASIALLGIQAFGLICLVFAMTLGIGAWRRSTGKAAVIGSMSLVLLYCVIW